MKKHRLLALALLSLALAGLSGLELERLSPSLGVVLIPRPEAYAELGGPSVLANTLGAGLAFPLGGNFAFEPSLSFYWTYHLWEPGLDRALPAELEHRTSFTLGFLLEAPFILKLRLAERLGLGLGLGPALHLRAGFLAAGLGEELLGELRLINGFFYEGLRFLYPESLLRLEYGIGERVDLGLSLQALWPLFNLWNGSPSFWDEAVFGVQAGLRFRLR